MPTIKPHSAADLVARAQFVSKELGLTEDRLSKISGEDPATIKAWMEGRKTPSKVEAAGIIHLIQNHRPTRLAISKTHHLYFSEAHGWRIRCTITIKRKLVGERVRRNLRTRDLFEAIKRRELLIEEWRKLGLEVCVRKQKTKTNRKP